MDFASEQRMHAEHYAKQDRHARWLGLDAVRALVPFTREQIRAALDAGDVHLNTLPLHVWDKAHGEPTKKPTPCDCCKQMRPREPSTLMRGLVRQAVTRDVIAGREPLLRAWSLSDTVCVLKHVARYYIAAE